MIPLIEVCKRMIKLHTRMIELYEGSYRNEKEEAILHHKNERIACYDAILKLDPKNIKILLEQGTLLSQMNRHFEAYENFTNAFEIAPWHTSYHQKKTLCNMGQCDCHLKDSTLQSEIHAKPTQQKWQNILEEFLDILPFSSDVPKDLMERIGLLKSRLEKIQQSNNISSYPDYIFWTIREFLKDGQGELGIEMVKKIQRIPELKFILLGNNNDIKKTSEFIELLKSKYTPEGIFNTIKISTRYTPQSTGPKVILNHLYNAVQEYLKKPLVHPDGIRRANLLIGELTQTAVNSELNIGLIILKISHFIEENPGPTSKDSLYTYIVNALKESTGFCMIMRLELPKAELKGLNFQELQPSIFIEFLTKVRKELNVKIAAHQAKKEVVSTTLTTAVYTASDVTNVSSGISGSPPEEKVSPKSSGPHFFPFSSSTSTRTAESKNLSSSPSTSDAMITPIDIDPTPHGIEKGLSSSLF